MKYVIIQYPESKDIMNKSWFATECHCILDRRGLAEYGHDAYFIPEERYYEVFKPVANYDLKKEQEIYEAIENSTLSPRARNVMKRAITNYSERNIDDKPPYSVAYIFMKWFDKIKLGKYKDCGVKTLKEVKVFFEQYGLHLTTNYLK